MQRRPIESAIAAFIAGVMLSPIAMGSYAAKADEPSVPCAATQPAEITTAGETEAASPATAPTAAAPAAADAETVRTHLPRFRFSEVFPDPAGADELGEFIEIENPDDAEADAHGWTISNAAGKSYALASTLGPRSEFALLYAETKVTLANTGTTLVLRDPEGHDADTLTYPGPAKTGKSYARGADGTWRWTSKPTPGSTNEFDDETAAAPTAQVATEPAEPAVSPAQDAAPPASAPTEEPRPFIAALMPDPAGDDAAEWIELGNDGASAPLIGWTLDDADGGSVPFSLDGTSIPAGGRMRIDRSVSKIALNNDGDTVRLIAPGGAVRQAVTYAIAPEGKTYEQDDGAWRWMPPDAPVPPQPAAAAPIDGSATAAAAPPADALSAGEDAPAEASVGDLAPGDDALLEIDGVVTLAPGVIGKRTFAIQDPDGRSGTFVRAYGTAPLPGLAPGDRVKVIGRRASGAAVLSTTARGLTRVSSGKLDYEERSPAELGDDENGMAVAVSGVVTRRGRTALTVADAATAGKEIAVRSGIREAFDAKIAVGGTVTIKGVFRTDGVSKTVIVSSKNAVFVTPPVEVPQDAPGGRTVAAPASGNAPDARTPMVFGFAAEKAAPAWAAGGIIAAAVAAVVAAIALSRRRRTEELDRLGADR